MQTFVEERKEEDRAEEIFLTDYLQDVALLTDLDSKGDDDAPRVSLMTVHAAKGLEFPTVFVVGLEENIFPSPISAVSLRELEEERRLLYVAITRAEKRCVLTNAKNRFRYGKMEFDNPSRFIDEIDSRLVQTEGESSGMDSGYGGRMPWDRDDYSRTRRSRWEQDDDEPEYLRGQRRQKSVVSQFMPDPKPSFGSQGYKSEPKSAPRSDSYRSEPKSSSLNEGNFKSVRAVNAARRIMGKDTPVSGTNSSLGGLQEGVKIEHQRFGVGTVVKLEGSGENAKATVEFVNSGRKQLLLKFAKFTVVS